VGKHGFWQVGVSRDSHAAKPLWGKKEANLLLLPKVQTHFKWNWVTPQLAQARTTSAVQGMQQAACWQLSLVPHSVGHGLCKPLAAKLAAALLRAPCFPAPARHHTPTASSKCFLKGERCYGEAGLAITW